MICSRRTVLHLALGGVMFSVTSRVAAAEPVWTGPRDVDEFSVLGDEILTVGDYLRVLDAATGQERRSTRLRKPSNAEGPDAVATTESVVVFGWYVWHDDVYITCVDSRSLRLLWQRRMKIVDRERENIPYVVPLVNANGLFVLITNKHSENLFRLGADSGEVVWSRYIERFAAQRALAWHGNRLLVRSRVRRGAQALGHLHAIDPATGSTIWQIALEGQDDSRGDTVLIAGDRGYIAAPVPPGEACRLHIVDLATGSLADSFTIDRLSDPFAYHNGIVYFGGNTPTAWDVNTRRPLWRTDLRKRGGRLVSMSDAVFDAARQRIYLGELDHSFFVLSSTDGSVLSSIDVRRGYTSPGLMALYGAYRMRLVRNLLLVGAGERRLFAYATGSL
jgi:outer membrane protein assembly factor BamB